MQHTCPAGCFCASQSMWTTYSQILSVRYGSLKSETPSSSPFVSAFLGWKEEKKPLLIFVPLSEPVLKPPGVEHVNQIQASVHFLYIPQLAWCQVCIGVSLPSPRVPPYWPLCSLQNPRTVMGSPGQRGCFGPKQHKRSVRVFVQGRFHRWCTCEAVFQVLKKSPASPQEDPGCKISDVSLMFCCNGEDKGGEGLGEGLREGFQAQASFFRGSPHVYMFLTITITITKAKISLRLKVLVAILVSHSECPGKTQFPGGHIA